MDEYAEALGTDPSLVRSDDEVAAMVQAEQQAMAQQQAMATAQQGVDMAKTASDIDTGGDNAVAQMMRNAGLA